MGWVHRQWIQVLDRWVMGWQKREWPFDEMSVKKWRDCQNRSGLLPPPSKPLNWFACHPASSRENHASGTKLCRKEEQFRLNPLSFTKCMAPSIFNLTPLHEIHELKLQCFPSSLLFIQHCREITIAQVLTFFHQVSSRASLESAKEVTHSQ